VWLRTEKARTGFHPEGGDATEEGEHCGRERVPRIKVFLLVADHSVGDVDRIWLLSSFMRASHRAGRGKRVEDQ